ncbi:LVIVD repeat-containing protein [Vitiosangium sp. GDMCC 1.1324]|uniref:LVIVD repeat-containing protein n=1 Tax=Vitiosangium sp. (strain GDMCC 1.1324) TaxID=2138576 RepID=UPI000D37E374|nr:hypothetical protein [Vitiosangium sp. GDMCC 1.1324]PTL80533.1 hypothetical protein DAT35_28275 [Vitiosangium sp. GDMCC 1.1324]
MNRLLVATTGVLLLSTGCKNTVVEPKHECELESFNLSACDRSGFASVKAEGIWHANVTLSGVPSPGTFSLVPQQSHLLGTPLSVSQVEGDTFFLASDYQGTYSPMRFAIAGCQAPTPEQVKGEFRRCADGTMDLQGTFEAVRVKRVAGEQEQSGVELVSETALPRGVPQDVFVSGGYAYVTALADGLFVYDVSNPAAPKKVAEITPTSDTWYRSWVKGQTLYVSSAKEGLIIYDVSNPAAPKRVGALPSPSVQGWGLYVDGDRLYLVSPSPDAEVLIYDVSTPATPKLLSRYYDTKATISAGETPVEAVAVNNRLYIGYWRYGLGVADVTDGTKPVVMGHFGYDNATSRPVAAGTIGDRTIAFESSEGWGSMIRALDVTDPEHISVVGQFQMRPESTVGGLTLVGSKLYVAHTQDGLRILDMSNPSTPRQLAYYNTWRETDPGRGRTFIDGLSGLRVPGDGYIYATETSRGLLVFREQ